MLRALARGVCRPASRAAALCRWDAAATATVAGRALAAVRSGERRGLCSEGGSRDSVPSGSPAAPPSSEASREKLDGGAGGIRDVRRGSDEANGAAGGGVDLTGAKSVDELLRSDADLSAAASASSKGAGRVSVSEEAALSIRRMAKKRRSESPDLHDPTCPPLQKKKKPRTPGTRHQRLLDLSMVYTGDPLPHLTKRLPRTGGRNNLGRICTWHRGGGYKRYWREVDFKRRRFPDRPATVVRIEHDPNRTALIAVVRYDDMPEWKERYIRYCMLFDANMRQTDKAPVNPALTRLADVRAEKLAVKQRIDAFDAMPQEQKEARLHERKFFYDWKKGRRFIVRQKLARAPFLTEEERTLYILCPQKLRVGQRIMSSIDGPVDIVPGNAMPLRYMPIGTVVHNIEFRPGGGGKICRAAGTSATLLEKKEDEKLALLRMQSKELRYVWLDCLATVGVVSNPEYKNQVWGKAGWRRNMGWRPTVRGVAMNPVDHPHGGGEGKSSGGRPSVTPWGKPTKCFYRTRKKKKDRAPSCQIIQRRPVRGVAQIIKKNVRRAKVKS